MSLGRDGGGFQYTFENGTSMAAPHVAGVVSLMKGLDPTLGLQDALAYLTGTARPLDATACERPTGADCGAGLIDAAAALAALQSGVIPTPGGGALTFSPDPADFGADLVDLTVTLTNTTGATVDLGLDDEYVASPENPGAMLDDAVFANPLSGSLAGGASVDVVLTIDREQVTADGAYQFELFLEADTTDQSMTVRFEVGDLTVGNPDGPTIVAAFLDDGTDELVFSGAEDSDGFIAAFDFAVLVGDNLVIAWTDVNDDVEINEGDYIGIYPDAVPVAPSETATGIDFAVERVVDVEAWRAKHADLGSAAVDWFGRLEAMREGR